ncbi:MAG: TonB-dependent receptor [Gemmatimonadetes bacterium]|nr:TonB-dependent receptor [Gemmatimonadota bacterium]
MIRHLVRSLPDAVRRARWVAAVLALVAAPLAAQGPTGKIEGYVRDQAGVAVANVQVRITGTAFATTTNPAGYYFFNSVPAGVYDVRASYVGYKPTETRGFRVLSGQTVTLDFALEQTAVEIQEITVVAAANVLVPRDQVTSKQLIDGSYTDKLPVDRLNQVFALQPGVVASPGTTLLSVRGGRPDENNTYVDGVPVQSGNRGTGSGRALPSLQVGTNAFEDASITTGATSAEFGNAQGGVIAITTRTGGQRFSGNIGFETDELSGRIMGSGFNRLQASLGGPIAGDLTFFVSGVLDGNRFGNFGYRGEEVPAWSAVGVDTTFAIPTSTSATADTLFLPVYNYALSRGDCDAPYVANAADPEIRNNYGYDCRGRLGFGGGSLSNAQVSGKLNYSFGTGSRVALTYLGSRALARGARGIDNTFGTTNTNQVVTLNWNQVLTRSASRQMAIDAYLSYQTDRSINSLLTAESERNSRDPFLGWYVGGFDYEYDDSDFAVTEDLVRAYRVQDANSPITLYDRNNTQQYLAQAGYGFDGGNLVSRGNPGLVGAFGGVPGTLNYATERRIIGKANLDWQLDRYNRLKIGGEYTDSRMDTYANGALNQGFSDIWLASPVRYNLFAEDRLDLGDVVLVGGLRYDYFDLGASKWKDYPRISSAPNFDADNLDQYLEPYTAHDYLSPHIQVAFPVTERTNFRLSYAQQVQTPDYSVALFGSNTDLAITNTNNNYGTDLDFGKTILFEFGVRHAFDDDMVLDVTVYNKDNLANAAGRLIPRIDPRTQARSDLRLTVNQDFGNTRGVDLRIDRRFGQIFNGVLSYSFQDARNTGSDPFTYINFGSRVTSAITGNATPPPQAAQPVGFSRPHSIAAQFAFNFPADYKQGTLAGAIMSRLGIFGTARYASGTPYTRCDPSLDDDLAIVAPAPAGSAAATCNTLGGDFNAARLPAFKNVDLRVTKGLRLGGLDLTAYADMRNVFNIQNILTVFAQTGTTSNARYRTTLAAQDSAIFAQNATANGAYDRTTGDIILPGSDAECGAWVTTGNNPSPPNCYFLRKGEQRFGNGDGIYTLAEQRVASDIQRLATFHISRFTGAGRTLRFGMEVNF